MQDKSNSVEERIITAAIECIEQNGVQGATNRRIAAMAGVNNAAINYYFRSKEVLLRRCMEVTLDNAFDFRDFSTLPGGSAEVRCTAIFNDLIIGGLNYPGLTRAHFYDLLTTGKYESLVVEKINDFVRNLALHLQEFGLPLDEPTLQLACVQITSAVMMAILAPRLFQQSFGLDIADASTRDAFVGRMVRQLLA